MIPDILYLANDGAVYETFFEATIKGGGVLAQFRRYDAAKHQCLYCPNAEDEPGYMRLEHG